MSDGSYRTAWHMCHRVRAGLADENFQKLMGIVEVDETYIGGKNHNRHWHKRRKGMGGQGSGKDIVIGAVQRKGNHGVSRVVARVIENTLTETFERFVRETVSTEVSLLATDEHSGYRRVAGEYPPFWSLMKRGVVGTFHKVSAKYLPLYVAEFEFRYNNRENPDISGAAISAC